MKNVLLLFVLCLLGNVSRAAGMILVNNNQPNATILIREKSPQPIQTAALDLQHYIEKMSGVKIPIANDAESVKGIMLKIGDPTASQIEKLPQGDLKTEAYGIEVQEDAIYFYGKNPTPSAYAVYDFLSDKLGVRWFAPGDMWEYVPPSNDRGRLVVDVQSYVESPDTTPRLWSGHALDDDWRRWNLRNKVAQTEKIVRRNFQNSIYKIFPPSKYAKSNPEYYPLIDGKRWIPPRDNYIYWWPSVGNKDVQRLTVAYIRKYFDENPDQDSFSLGMDDVSYVCGDENSRAMDSSPGDFEKRRFSSRFYKFVNIIAREVKKTHPNKYIGVLIYNSVREIPSDVEQLEDNVFGYLTQNTAAWFNPQQKSADQELTRAWKKKIKYLSRYDYFGLSTFTPRVYPHFIDEAVKFDHSLDLEGAYVEMRTFLPNTAPMIWAYAQLQWHADKNIDGLLGEFYEKMYGPASAEMQKYYDLMESSWGENRPGRDHWVHRDIVRQAISISPQAADEGMNVLNQAIAKAQTNQQKQRVDITLAALQYAAYAIKGYALAEELSRTEINQPADAQALRQRVLSWGKYVQERDLFWKEARLRNDLLGKHLRQIGIMENSETLDFPALTGMARLADWYEENQPTLLPTLKEEFNGAFSPAINEAWLGLWEVKSSSLVSLLNNAAFNTTEGKQIPQPWAIWGRFQNPSIQAQPANRKGSLQITTPAVKASRNVGYLMQNLTVKPGQLYHATAHFKSDGNSRGVMILRYDAPSGRREVVAHSVAEQTNPMVVTARIPQDATKVTLIIGSEPGVAEFSNVSVYSTR